MKRPPRRHRPEAAIHAAVVGHLRLRGAPGLLFCIRLTGLRVTSARPWSLKRMGVLPGASDLILWHRGNSFSLELKAPGGRLSDAQRDFLARFNNAGGHSACAEGIDEALQILEGWQLLIGRSQ
jgi:VRR-NUC domain